MADEIPLPPDLFNRMSEEQRMQIIDLLAQYNPRALQTGNIFNELYFVKGRDRVLSPDGVPARGWVDVDTPYGQIADYEGTPGTYVHESLHNMFKELQHEQGEPDPGEIDDMEYEQAIETLHRKDGGADHMWMARTLADLIGPERVRFYEKKHEANPEELLALLVEIRQRQAESAAAGARNPRGQGLEQRGAEEGFDLWETLKKYLPMVNALR